MEEALPIRESMSTYKKIEILENHAKDIDKRITSETNSIATLEKMVTLEGDPQTQKEVDNMREELKRLKQKKETVLRKLTELEKLREIQGDSSAEKEREKESEAEAAEEEMDLRKESLEEELLTLRQQLRKHKNSAAGVDAFQEYLDTGHKREELTSTTHEINQKIEKTTEALEELNRLQKERKLSYHSELRQYSAQRTENTKMGDCDTPVARALYAFKAANDNELSFNQDDLVYLVDFSKYKNLDWWPGKLDKDGQVGFFPANYVQIVSAQNKDPVS